MGQTKRLYEMNEQLIGIDDFGYQYEQWLEERRLENLELQYQEEVGAYQEMLGDVK